MPINTLGGELRDRYQPAPVTMPPINLAPLDTKTIEAEAREAAAKVKTIRAGRDAWEQIAKSGSFSSWVAVGKALAIGRDFALRATLANRPEGRRYCAEFSAWIEAHGFAGMQKSVRSVAIELAENIEAIEAWRSTLSEKDRRRLMHPLSNVRRWRASTAHGNGKCPQDWKREAATALRRFIFCVGNLPADEAQPLWQSVAAEATTHVASGGIFLPASGGVGVKEGDLRPPWCSGSSV